MGRMLTVQPAEKYGNGTRVVAQPVPSSLEDAKLCGTVRLGQLTSIGRGDGFIVVAVHDQHWPRRDAACAE